mmetsp:Transcript_19522/g.64543  ORF Transcript_19522/g.64543 Transcript_19522/m.64543 type:complete len:275 (+) Transcript_19522:1765-2589(+)
MYYVHAVGCVSFMHYGSTDSTHCREIPEAAPRPECARDLARSELSRCPGSRSQQHMNEFDPRPCRWHEQFAGPVARGRAASQVEHAPQPHSLAVACTLRSASQARPRLRLGERRGRNARRGAALAASSTPSPCSSVVSVVVAAAAASGARLEVSPAPWRRMECLARRQTRPCRKASSSAGQSEWAKSSTSTGIGGSVRRPASTHDRTPPPHSSAMAAATAATLSQGSRLAPASRPCTASRRGACSTLKSIWSSSSRSSSSGVASHATTSPSNRN